MTTDPALLLATPPGEPGSGRVRYGAAMALWRQGRLSAAALEVYRVASADDAQDPAPMLAEAGLETVPLPAPDRAAALRTLLDEADRYLARLPGEGVGEVRQGLAAARGPVRAGAASGVPVVAAHLNAALDALARDEPSLAQAIAHAAPHLGWVTYDAYPPERIGPAFARGHAFATLVGQGAPFPARDFDAGLFLIAPHIFYRDHAHPAPELYAPLTGPHRWRFAPGAPLVARPAHAPVWNPPNRPHATLAGEVPFLCLYGWTRDVAAPAVVLDAPDWAAIETAA